MAHALRLLSWACVSAIAGCSQSPDEDALPVTETFKDFGDYVVHFNALTTDQLIAEIARQHGIVRSENRAMLNVTVLKKVEGSVGIAVAATVSAWANNLTGQLKNLVLREIREEEAIYYIAECAVADGETLIFTIDVTPIDETALFSVRYMKRFFL